MLKVIKKQTSQTWYKCLVLIILRVFVSEFTEEISTKGNVWYLPTLLGIS